MLWVVPIAPIVASGVAALAPARRTPLVAGAGVAVSVVGGLAASVGAWTASWGWGPFLGLSLSADGIARIMVVVVPVVALAVVAYTASDHREDPGRRRLLSLLTLFVGAMQLVVLAGDFLTLLIGWEIVAACSWALIGHRWREDAPRAGQEAFVVTWSGGVWLVLAAGAAFHATGSLRFADLGGLGGPELHVLTAGVLAAALTKSAQVPFSPWLFSAMAGPTPVSALLHSATMVAAGAYLLARLAPVLLGAGWFAPLVIGVGIASALAGGIVALIQTDAKRALAASTSAQYGLILVAVGAASVPAASEHLATHAVLKALLFLGVGAAIHATGSRHLSDMRLGRALPRVAVAFAVGALALAGVPPLGGAFSKEAITAAAWEHATWSGLLTLLAGGLSAMYAGRLLVVAFGRGERREATLPGPAVLPAIASLGAISVALGLLGLPATRDALAEVTGGRVAPSGTWEVAASLALIVAAAGVVGWLDRRALLLTMGMTERHRAAAADWLLLPELARMAVVTPVLGLARALARLDERVVDAGVRAVGRLADAFGRVFRAWGERGMDGVVEGVGRGALASARGSRRVDERVVDGAVEGMARGVGAAGAGSRLLQSGLAHRSYVILALGLAVAVAVALAVR